MNFHEVNTFMKPPSNAIYIHIHIYGLDYSSMIVNTRVFIFVHNF